ncbi:MAG: hypothetical protein KAU03_05485 [Candidatus Altiarchaeales archaeon]|nr:hypothetical protein [Candidatus Altiarchaeales archaeon]
MEEKLLNSISRSLNISKEEILEESINSFLDRELRKAYSEIEKLKGKYEVDKPGELKEKIEKGKEKPHPAWEELIEWERLHKRIIEIEKWRKEIPIPA